MGKGKKSSRGKRSSKHVTAEDVESGTGGLQSTVGGLPAPVMLLLFGLESVFGLVFIIVGSININKCNIDPMIPIWLIMMGVVLLLSGIHEGIQYMQARSNRYKKRQVMPTGISILLALVTIGFFISGNVFVYMAWGVEPDYGHYWFSNGCNMSAYILAFTGVIIMDIIIGLMVIGGVIYYVSILLKGK